MLVRIANREDPYREFIANFGIMPVLFESNKILRLRKKSPNFCFSNWEAAYMLL